MGVIKKDVLLPKPEQTVVPAHHGPMLGSPDGNKCYLESSQPVEAATVYTANLGLSQFYGTTTSTDACTTPVSFQADARFSQLFNGADPESRASARLEVGSTSDFPSIHRLRLRRLYPSRALPFSSSARQRRHLHRLTRFHVTLTSNTSGNPVSTSSTRQTCTPGRRSSPHALHAPSIRQR